MIYVCDAIMGSGKTQAAITYMNEHSDGKFIYVTPYLDETERIANDCKGLRFYKPKKKDGSKVRDSVGKLREGKNIATTHQAFRNYTQEMAELITAQGYTLIIDESIQSFEPCDIDDGDIELLKRAGYLEESDDGESAYRVSNTAEYKGSKFKDFMFHARSQKLTRIDGKCDSVLEESDDDGSNDGNGYKSKNVFYWSLTPELLSSFKDVFILTYLFEAQDISAFLTVHGLHFGRMGVEKIDAGNGYRFKEGAGSVAGYEADIMDLIEIIGDEKMNSIGDGTYSLSKNWYKKSSNKEAVTQLKNNIYNVLRHKWEESKSGERMWSTFKAYKGKLKGNGYTTSFVALNERASNKYRGRKYLAYACNIFMPVDMKSFLSENGVPFDEDKYALSVMLQWIWRSAIRDGEKIHLYLPSSRMRRILYEWMDSISGEGGEVPVGRGFDSGTNAA